MHHSTAKFTSEKEQAFIEKFNPQPSRPTIGTFYQGERYSHLRPNSALEQSRIVEPGKTIAINIYNTFQSKDCNDKNANTRILINKANIQAICKGLLQLKENGTHQQHRVVIYLGGNRDAVAFAKQRIEQYLAKIAWDAQMPLIATSYVRIYKAAIHFVSFFYDEFQKRKYTALDIENRPHVWTHSNKNPYAAAPQVPYDDYNTFRQTSLKWLRSNRGIYFNLYLDLQSIRAIKPVIHEYFSRFLKADLEIAESVVTTSVEAIGLGDYVSIEFIEGSKIEDYILMEHGDPDNGIIAISSPLGRCLLGSQVGDELEYPVRDITHRIRVLSVENNYMLKH